jgi:hypothetical protein
MIGEHDRSRIQSLVHLNKCIDSLDDRLELRDDVLFCVQEYLYRRMGTERK